ncbi:MAG: hypothetical protein V4726_18800 [Verrucomicrobiota bacterium]
MKSAPSFCRRTLPARVRFLALLLCGVVLTGGNSPAQSVILDTFDGLNGASTGFAPWPDTSGAAGQQGLLQVVNSEAAYYPRNGGNAREPLWRVPLDRSFDGALPGSTDTREPRVVYDRLTDRFLMIILDVVKTQPQKSWLHLLVSRSGHPQGKMSASLPPVRVFDPAEWHRYRFDLTRPVGLLNAAGGAYPSIGVDARHLYVSLNFYRIAADGETARFAGDLIEAGIYTFDKASLISGTGAAPDGTAPPAAAPLPYFPSPTDGNLQPAMPAVPAPEVRNAWFLGLDQDAFDTLIDTFYIDYAGAFLTDDDQTTISDQSLPDPAPQPPPAVDLNTLGFMHGAVRDGAAMWGVYVTEDDSSDRSVIRWVKMRPQSGQTVVEAQGKLDAGGDRSNFLPAIGINPAGSLCISWTVTSPTLNPAVYYATMARNQGSGAQAFSQPQQLVLSSAAYAGDGDSFLNPSSWGECASVVSDPVDGSFWICHPYVHSATRYDWGTWWAKVTPLPLAVFSQSIGVITPAQPIADTGSLLPLPGGGRLIKTVTVCTGQNLSLKAGVSGQHSYRWLKDGEPLAGAVNQSVIPINAVDLSHQAVYRIEAENGAGVKAWSDEFYLDVKIPPVAVLRDVQPRLRLGPGNSGYFEVRPDPLLLEEMQPLTYTWNRPGHATLFDGRVKAFLGDSLKTAADAAGVEGTYTCTVSNACGSITLTGNLITGPAILTQPAAPQGAIACGPPVTLSVGTDGVLGTGEPETRADFPPPHHAAAWFDHGKGITKITWRHRSVPIVPGGRFAVASPASGGALTITDPDYEDEGDYDCLIEDAWGESRRVLSQKTWLQLQPTPPWLTLTAQGPDSREGHGIIYDPARRETVLFGGEAYGSDPRPNQPDYYGRYSAADTWVWNGSLWTRRNPAHQPPPLRDFALAYDQQRQRVVLFGGRRTDGSAAAAAETWEWDGTDWTRSLPALSPPARTRHTMCYDSVRREVLLIGGDIPGGGGAADAKKLWAYNGTDWVVKNADFMGTAGSAPYYGPAFAFDERRGVAVLYDRIQSGSSYVLPEWNGTAWSAGAAPAGGTYGGLGRGMFYDPWRRCVTVTGGSAAANSTDKALMHYDGGAWRGEVPAVLDGVTGSTLDLLNVRVTANNEVAFDTHRRAYVWFHSRSPFYTGQAFTREIRFSCKPWIAHLPPAVNVRTGQMGQFRVVAAGLPALGYQWFKNGAPLTDGGNILGSRTPSLKVLRSAAADAGAYSVAVANDHGQVLSGPVPLTVTGPVLTDPAALSAAPGSVPAAARPIPPALLKVDAPGTGSLLLEGAGSGPLPPAPVVYTWEHRGRPAGASSAVPSLSLSHPDYGAEGLWELFAQTGNDAASRRFMKGWRVLVPGELPYITLQDAGNIPRLTDAAMAYDSRRGVTVVFGGLARGTLPGSAQTGNFISDQTWEWDGLAWLLRRPPVSPPPLDQAGMVFDATRGRMVLFGGRKYTGTASGSVFSLSNETWEYDGLNWTRPLPQISPPPNTRMSLCHDPARGETLLIGGDIFPYPERHALWAWNGLNWTRREAPMPYRSATGAVEMYGQNAMAFDENRGVAVLFGSFSGSNADYDVLEWDGSHWRAISPEAAPAGETPPRSTATGTAFYDPWRQLTGVAGGVSLTNEKSLRYWDGIRWTGDSTAIRDELGTHAWAAHERQPGSRNTVVFDRARRALVWHDAPAYDFSARQTRELHFTSVPKILRLPPVHSGLPGGAVSLRAIAAGRTPFTWRWSRDAPLSDSGRVTGSAASALGLTLLTGADAGAYSVSAGNALGGAAASTDLTLESGLQVSGLQDGSGFWISWPGAAAALQAAETPAGPWLPMPGAVSPIRIPALEPRAFFRLATP